MNTVYHHCNGYILYNSTNPTIEHCCNNIEQFKGIKFILKYIKYNSLDQYILYKMKIINMKSIYFIGL